MPAGGDQPHGHLRDTMLLGSEGMELRALDSCLQWLSMGFEEAPDREKQTKKKVSRVPLVWTQGELEHCIKPVSWACAVWSSLSATAFDSL